MSKSGGKIVAAFLAGVAAGAGIGLLLAPDKGENTRKHLKESLSEITDKAKESIDELAGKTKEQIAKLRTPKAE
ncbi:MAG: hypothetical protein RIS47_922 [Bacteroidota bacterium]|jgi:gas vesicle protein